MTRRADNLELDDYPFGGPVADTWVDDMIDDAVRRDTHAAAIANGEVGCPGPPDAHEHLTPDDVCTHCGAAL